MSPSLQRVSPTDQGLFPSTVDRCRVVIGRAEFSMKRCAYINTIQKHLVWQMAGNANSRYRWFLDGVGTDLARPFRGTEKERVNC